MATTVSKIYYQQQNYVKGYRGSTLEWEVQQPASEPFYIKNLYNGANTVTLTKTGSPDGEGYIQYSLDNIGWTPIYFNGGTTWTQTLDNQNDKLYFRSINGVSRSGSDYIKISAAENYSVGGKLQYLVDANAGVDPQCQTYCFYYLFYSDSKLISAADLDFSGFLLNDNCCYSMFYGCTNLTTAPNLPATTLANNCYQAMFYGCSSLTTAPNLPATTLAPECYRSMFQGCSSLTTAPSLPATTLATYCYHSMLKGCTSLTTIPSNYLPVTTLADYCYSQMFYGCSSLTTTPVLPATTLAQGCYSDMFRGTSITTAPVLPATTLANYCYQQMFYGCTSLTTAPSLPATTLAEGCYSSMFRGCTSLTAAPALPAIELVNNCYYRMFYGCTSLNKITTYATYWSTDAASNWVTNVAQNGDFYNLGGADITRGKNGIPTGWTEHTSL